jgi:hypothetical protein
VVKLLLAFYRIHPIPDRYISHCGNSLASHRILRVERSCSWVCVNRHLVIRIIRPHTTIAYVSVSVQEIRLRTFRSVAVPSVFLLSILMAIYNVHLARNFWLGSFVAQ